MCVCFSRLDYCNSLLADCPKTWLSIFFLNSKGTEQCCKAHFQNNQMPTSLLCFILFTGYLLSRGSNTNCLCFALRSFLIRLPSTRKNFFTFTLLPVSSALLQTPECSESCGQRSFSYQAPVIWNQLPVSVRHSTSVSSSKSSLKTLLFSKTFSLVPLPQ